VRAVFIGGTTGESASLTTDERLDLARRWSEVVRGTSLTLVVHVGSNCMADARTLTAQAATLNAAAVAMLAPSYFKPGNVETLIECCRSVADAAPGTPFYYYDIPSMTGVSLPMAEFLERGCGRIPSLAGLKFTNPDQMAYQRCLALRDGQGQPFDIPWGIDEALLGAMALGARGAVGSTYNFAAPVSNRIFEAVARGDLDAARADQLRSVRLIGVLMRYGYMAAAKQVMGWLGVEVGAPRLPILGLGDGQAALLRRDLEQIGFFDWGRAT
jgi:N-acetylneuraminate lyase